MIKPKKGIYFTSLLFKFPPKRAKNCAELLRKRVLGGSLLKPGKGGGEFVDLGRKI